jgi:DNA-binding TFAR19-related protein (PDSD5 family)
LNQIDRFVTKIAAPLVQLNLARAEDLVEEYLVMLAQLGQIAEVIAQRLGLIDEQL